MRDPYHNYALREARARLGYTVDYLAELTRINLQTLHAYERLRCMPNPAAAQRIANALERDVNELFPRCLAKLVREINRERREERAEESMRIPWSSVPRRRLLVEDVVAEDEGDDENILRERMESILETLGNRERIVLAYTFGLSEYGQLSIEDVAMMLRLSTRQAVYHIRDLALRKLQHPMRRRVLEDVVYRK